MTTADASARQTRWNRLVESLAAAPHAHDFFALLRTLDATHPGQPRLGRAPRPRDEPIRLGQDPDFDFAAAPLSSFQPGATRPRLGQRFFGLLGPMGPMPLHVTEIVRERLHARDATPSRFLDLFHHRALVLFYRAWAQAQPVTHLDRPDDDAFSRWVGSLFGAGGPAFERRDRLSDATRRFHAGTLARGARSAEGLVKVLSSALGVPVRLEPYVGHWLTMAESDRTRIVSGASGVGAPALGRNAIAGQRVWDRQYRYRLHLGPLDYAQYVRFLPGQPARLELRDWVRQAAGLSMQYDVVPWLRSRDVPPLVLGQGDAHRGRLGQTAWLGSRRALADRGDLRMRPEA